MNLIWCLDDVHEANGATRYLPGSHRFQTFEDVPAGAAAKTLPFIAPAGSVIAMEGRLWHTSGANVTQDERRTLLFALYSRGFVRGQVNWEVTLSPTTKAALGDDTRELMGMMGLTNAALAFPIIDLR
jgi:ectoine hydroxylase-related dioxygenase (phytanoyl-CoA dioxygenase family)